MIMGMYKSHLCLDLKMYMLLEEYSSWTHMNIHMNVHHTFVNFQFDLEN